MSAFEHLLYFEYSSSSKNMRSSAKRFMVHLRQHSRFAVHLDPLKKINKIKIKIKTDGVLPASPLKPT